jgi:hypothetical protein
MSGSTLNAAGGGGGTPGGLTTQVQFNDAGAFGGDANFKFDKTNQQLFIPGGGLFTPGLSFGGVGGLWLGGGAIGSYIAYGINNVNNFVVTQAYGAIIPNYLQFQSGFNAGIAADIALARNASGILEVNNGTAGTYRDLKLRTLLLNPGAAPTGVEGALYGNSTDHKIYYHNGTSFVDLTAGGAGGSPGGSSGQVQFNNAGAFAGDAGLAYTNFLGGNILNLQGVGSGTVWGLWTANTSGSSGYLPSNALGIYNASTTSMTLVLDGSNVYANSAGIIGWQSSGRAGTLDTGFYRNAAGVVEVNNGTPGTYRDLIVRNLTVTGTCTGCGGGGAALSAWPVGSVFITIVPTDPATLLGGGTWVRFGQGKMLVSQDGTDTAFDTAEETGGAKTVTLAIANLPSHDHSMQAHTHDGSSLSTVSAGGHNHTANGGAGFKTTTGGSQSVTGSGGTVAQQGFTSTDGAHTHTISGNTGAASSSNTSATGSGTAITTLSPYIVVYMWKRTG